MGQLLMLEFPLPTKPCTALSVHFLTKLVIFWVQFCYFIQIRGKVENIFDYKSGRSRGDIKLIRHIAMFSVHKGRAGCPWSNSWHSSINNTQLLLLMLIPYGVPAVRPRYPALPCDNLLIVKVSWRLNSVWIVCFCSQVDVRSFSPSLIYRSRCLGWDIRVFPHIH